MNISEWRIKLNHKQYREKWQNYKNKIVPTLLPPNLIVQSILEDFVPFTLEGEIERVFNKARQVIEEHGPDLSPSENWFVAISILYLDMASWYMKRMGDLENEVMEQKALANLHVKASHHKRNFYEGYVTALEAFERNFMEGRFSFFDPPVDMRKEKALSQKTLDNLPRVDAILYRKFKLEEGL